ncbi:BZ3500_MvSof-1268-A1-R1_Chr1-3g01935 [Microbotryum saponariae]|uniref:BZ3500_MvSof-1268-A1-R1_Chr1-3g01935 protein n=1 Tax=Microbotryum saponariae TaxID=289078 RepID=A0A2X0L3Y2_9BASI|nr:BZ3500_MvSof-1268-A1-R1_Chr1-3g01935 [Microbotryum saponariae]SCZ94948.1 BZ3501_MvSof-1269-A2-R1_Chr1-3g01537 [Microbotryum saponariae]
MSFSSATSSDDVSASMMQHTLRSRPKAGAFNLADVAAAALARPRAPWTDQDDGPDYAEASCSSSSSSASSTSSVSSSSSSSMFSSPQSTAVSSPSTSAASSCPMSASNSFEGFALPAPTARVVASAPPTSAMAKSLQPAEPIFSSETRTHSRQRFAPKSPRAAEKAVAVDEPRRPADDDWSAQDFSLKLVFKTPEASFAPSNHINDDSEHVVPPAFFPSQRIHFQPWMRIVRPDGLPFTAIAGMQLGVTGMIDLLDPLTGKIVAQRMIADFCVDLSTGLKCWKRDAQAARHTQGLETELPGQERLPPGTYSIPLSMKIPVTSRMPPSFECAQFRIHYSMALTITAAACAPNGTPRRLKIYSLPFHILPSTLPAPAPELPVLKHDHPLGMLASLAQSFTLRTIPTGFHHVHPSLPTSHFSPGGHASIPVSLRIRDRPLEPTDLYIRLALVRKTYVRDSTRCSLHDAIEEEWGAPGVSVRDLNYPEEMLVEPWCRDEEEIVSRWGWIPYSSRPGADPTELAQVDINDIALPLHGLDPSNPAWAHGYSTELDLEPTAVPTLKQGACSWFSPVFRTRPPVMQEYRRHLHVSTRFYLSIEMGFASPQLGATLTELKRLSPDLDIPAPNTFTSPRAPATSDLNGTSVVNPFFTPSSTLPPGAAARTRPSPSPLAFPGTKRELFIPITIGSVAEPTMSALAQHAEPSCARQRAEREAREERGEDLRSEMGEGAEGAWICAPPDYEEALKRVPAYVL